MTSIKEQLFIDIMSTTIQSKIDFVNKHYNAYSNNVDFINMVSQRIRAKQDAKKMCEAGASIQSKYFAYAVLFMKFEMYENVKMCVDVIDIITSLVCDSIRIEYTGCDERQIMDMTSGYTLGIDELKQALADNNLLSEEAQQYE